MISAELDAQADFESWRHAARLLLQNQIQPSDVDWNGAGSPASLFQNLFTPLSSLKAQDRTVNVSKDFLGVAKRVICHSDPQRFARLYRILHRLQSNRHLLGNAVDPDIIWLTGCDKAVRRDRHKMHAFVRFRKVGMGRYRKEQYAAWFEPAHYITQLATPFFARRFPNMDWIIVTPHCTAIWDGAKLKFGPGGTRADVPEQDAVEDQWRVYFNSIFNPARLKVGAMMSEMPKKYWKNMPEAVDIPQMIARANEREAHMRKNAVSTPNPLAAKLKTRLP